MTSKLKDLFKRLRPFILVLGISLILYAGFLLAKGIWLNHRSEMKTSHVFVCDNSEHKSDFDTWLSDELHVDWVPTYIILKNNIIIGSFPGDIDVNEFSDKLATVVAMNIPIAKFPSYAITNLDGERKNISTLFDDNVNILEIHWIDCDDCKHQDENYTDEIYAKYSTDMIYRYYIRSDKNKVLEKYSKN